jgi:hypothetical protein
MAFLGTSSGCRARRVTGWSLPNDDEGGTDGAGDLLHAQRRHASQRSREPIAVRSRTGRLESAARAEGAHLAPSTLGADRAPFVARPRSYLLVGAGVPVLLGTIRSSGPVGSSRSCQSTRCVRSWDFVWNPHDGETGGSTVTVATAGGWDAPGGPFLFLRELPARRCSGPRSRCRCPPVPLGGRPPVGSVDPWPWRWLEHCEPRSDARGREARSLTPLQVRCATHARPVHPSAGCRALRDWSFWTSQSSVRRSVQSHRPKGGRLPARVVGRPDPLSSGTAVKPCGTKVPGRGRRGNDPPAAFFPTKA